MGGWVNWSPSDNRANFSSTATEVGLPTWTELGNTQVSLENFSKLGEGGIKFSQKYIKKYLIMPRKYPKHFYKFRSSVNGGVKNFHIVPKVK